MVRIDTESVTAGRLHATVFVDFKIIQYQGAHVVLAAERIDNRGAVAEGLIPLVAASVLEVAKSQTPEKS